MKQTKPEICYECDYIRHNTHTGGYVCINPEKFYCDSGGVGKATRACEKGKLNKKLIELYPDRYE